ncbi:MAG: ligase-associated DNA damage response endonuclease PdeM [Pseudomonadota bacterium]|nr:ligase-associated DNA damage response endonuclease PdeM [Pseudomonadota bacterium]
MKISLAGTEVHLTGDGLAFVPSLELLCATDLHFEKGSFFAPFATLLPPYDSDDTLTRLERAVRLYKPRRFLALGDSFHDLGAPDRLRADHVQRLNELISSVETWWWILGNHDPAIGAHIGGVRCNDLQLETIAFRHIRSAEPLGPELSGHFHPKATINLHGHSIRAPCFVQYGLQLILPSFGKFTGGLDVDSEAFIKAIPRAGRRLFMIHSHEVFAV